MADTVGVARYLDSISKAHGERSQEDLLAGFNPFVTVSRETGAGGRSFAEALVKELEAAGGPAPFRGWQVFDQELCRIVAEDPALRVSMSALLTEQYRGEVADYIAQFMAGLSPQTAVLSKVFEAVRALAGLGRVVIVGRAGACLTRRLPHGLHVRLVASRESRVRNMMGAFGLGRPEAERAVRDQDIARAALTRTYFKRDAADPLLYDLVFNTDTVPIARAASIAAQALRAMAGDYESKARAAARA